MSNKISYDRLVRSQEKFSRNLRENKARDANRAIMAFTMVCSGKMTLTEGAAHCKSRIVKNEFENLFKGGE